MNEDAPISIPVPPQIAAAWQALPPERRASFARAISRPGWSPCSYRVIAS